MLIPESVFPMSKVCDKESSRYALGAVRLERRGEECHAISTDGRRLIHAKWREDPDDKRFFAPADVSSVEGFETLVSADDWNEVGKNAITNRRGIRRLATAKRKAFSNALLSEESANGEISLSTTDGTKTRALVCKSHHGKFPTWNDIFPKSMPLITGRLAKDLSISDAYVSVRMSTALLSSLLDTIGKMTGDSDTVELFLRMPIDEKCDYSDSGVVLKVAESEGFPEVNAMIMPKAR